MNSVDFQRFLRRWVVTAVVAALICGVIAYAVSKVALQSVYTATVTMQVEPVGPYTPTTPSDPTYSVILAQTYGAVAQEHSIVQPAYQQAAGLETPAHQNSKISSQSPSTSCTADGVTALISCSVTADSAAFAETAANAVAAGFVHYQRNNSANSDWSVRITNPATVPSSPSGPHGTLNALIAFVVVLLLVLGAGLVEIRMGGPAQARPPSRPSSISAGAQPD